MPNPGDTYEYKGVFYTVLSVSDEVLAQYEDEWYPTVRYCRSEEIVVRDIEYVKVLLTGG